MWRSRAAMFLVVILCGSSMVSAAQTSAPHSPDSVTVVFKDGHTKSFSGAEISRLEFNPMRLVLKNGHEESLAASDVQRIEFQNAAGENGILGRNYFAGEWRVGDGAGSHFTITLERNGDARKTIGGKRGTWELVNGEAHITWDDGWHDAIRKAGEKHEKCAYSPGKSFDDKPSNVTDAERLNPQPI